MKTKCNRRNKFIFLRIISSVSMAASMESLSVGPSRNWCYDRLPRDGGAWWAAVHGVTKSWTWLSDVSFTFHSHSLEKEMATHSSVLAWRIPGMAEPVGLPSMGSHRVGHDWSDLAAAAAASVSKDSLKVQLGSKKICSSLVEVNTTKYIKLVHIFAETDNMHTKLHTRMFVTTVLI